MSDDKVTISVEHYEELLRAQKRLSALESGGVDNWEWYHESLKEGGCLDDDDDDDDQDS